MHPHIVQHEPGSCPICGMTLAKRQQGEKPVLPQGVTARVALAPSRVEQAGIKTSEVSYAPLNQVVTTVGYVAFDERRMASIVSRVPGKSRVEKLYINVTGQNVEAGQPLAELYSPELSQAIQELLECVPPRRSGDRAADRIRSIAGERSARAGPGVGRKAEAMGNQQSQIDEILAKGKADFTFPILSPEERVMCSRKTLSRARKCRKAIRCSRSSIWTRSGCRPRSMNINWAWFMKVRPPWRRSRRFPARPSRARRVHAAASGHHHAHGRGSLRHPEPRPSAAARDVRDSHARHAGGRHARVSQSVDHVRCPPTDIRES